MSNDHGHHGGPPPGEAPRWLDNPANIKKLTRGFFGVAALLFLADIVWFFAHKHATFGHETGERTTVQSMETWFGFYSIYAFVGIIVLVVLSVGLRQLVMQPEDFYSRDYPDPEDEFAGEHGAEDKHHG